MIHALLISALCFAGSLASASTAEKSSELAMAQAEAQAYRAAWMQLKSRDELLGMASLSDDVRDSHDQVARLAGELIRAERSKNEILEQATSVLQAAVRWMGETESAQKSVARAEFESAKRKFSAVVALVAQPRPLASGLTDAQVVAVDRNPQAMVLNLGTVQGAREGMPFRILRGDKVVGSCRLIEVRELISAAMAEQLSENIQPKVGDRVSVLAVK